MGTEAAFLDPGELHNESDVEQKVIFPFITAQKPFGLEYPVSSILTKRNVRAFDIDKGTKKKSYFPDYLLLARGLPRVVIEVKEPGADLPDALREARLYAHALNSIFKHINPVEFVVASDGHAIIAGRWDSEDVLLEIPLNSTSLASAEYGQLVEELCRSRIAAATQELQKTQKPQLFKPRRMIGGASVQNETIAPNTFGSVMRAELAHIFNPTTVEDRELIVRHAYVASRRRERFVEPIDRVIKAAAPPSETQSTQIEDTSLPREITEKFKDIKPLENKLLLIVGNVGAGKTTFVDYLQNVALPKESAQKTAWVRINMNSAPISGAEIYDWLRKNLISEFRALLTDEDTEQLAFLQRLYAVEVNRFRKGRGSLYTSEGEFNSELARELERLQSDLHLTAQAYTRFCATERGKLTVIVLDNCDKRTLDEQLLMFQAATWIQREFRSLVILPLREETYDNYRDKPPLDTALKDLVFRIEPPLFQNVLVKRVQVALAQLGGSAEKTRRYELTNGFHVDLAANDASFYLTSIIRSMFEHDRYIRRLITGLAGRNIRRALEIFIEFCTSGHIAEDQFLKIRQTEGNYALPLHVVTRVLLRLDRRLYDSDYSYLKNVIAASHLDDTPEYFARLAILRWYQQHLNQAGPSRVRGYFPISDVKSELARLGFAQHVVDREILYLIRAQCLMAEDFKVADLADEDLVRLGPAGWVHIDMLSNVEYLAAVAEDTFFFDKAAAQRVVELTRRNSLSDTLEAAEILTNFLTKRRESRQAAIDWIVGANDFDALSDLSAATEGIRRLRMNVIDRPWRDISSRLPVGSKVDGVIVNPHLTYGLFVEIEPGVSGLVPRSSLTMNVSVSEYETLGGERVQVEVAAIDELRMRMQLKLLGIYES